MPNRKVEIQNALEDASGVTLSRTLIPKLPPNYLSRKRLFPLFKPTTPGSTLVIAESGFGKTSLVAEWVRTQEKKTIWLTITSNDSILEMSSLFIQATRNVIPGFAPWFEEKYPMRAVEVVRRWGNDLLATGEEFIFVLDNLRNNQEKDVGLATKLVQEFPNNIHFIPIRKDRTDSIYLDLNNFGSVSVITETDLRFTFDEIDSLSKILGVDELTLGTKNALQAANGWPTATTMVLEHVLRTKEPVDFEKIISTESNPLRALAQQMCEILDNKERGSLVKLSVVNEFTHELAKVILQDEYSYDFINKTALVGNYFHQTSDPHQTFEFSELIRELLLQELRKDATEKASIHSRLMAFYENRLEINKAIEHAFLAGNFEQVREYFPNAARMLQATGRGDQLLRWSIYAGDTSPVGLLKRGTVELTGHLASLNYRTTQNLIDKLRFESSGTELEDFIVQITSGAQAYLDFTFADFAAMERNIEIAKSHPSSDLNLGSEDLLGLLRLEACKALILEDCERAHAIFETAKNRIEKSEIPNSQIILSSIKAIALFENGDFRRAFEEASITLNLSREYGFVGFMGPLDSLYIIARCQSEFDKPALALETFHELRDLAEQWKQWTWYFVADGFIAKDFVYKNQLKNALEVIKNARTKVEEISLNENLQILIDMNEVIVRFFQRDHDRLEVLLARSYKTRFIQQVQFSYNERVGKKNLDLEAKNLPAKSLQEKLWKHLAEASINLDSESVALREMRKALEIGAQTGAKNTFLRQEPELASLILKIAGENPTVYLEDLALAVAARIKNSEVIPEGFTTQLTKREVEVLRHLSTDRPISSIATTLHISINTMKTHLKNLYRKMNVENRNQAVEKAKANFIL